MLQELETLSPTTKKLIINVPKEVIQSETDSIYSQIQMSTSIPGFRQGKVPRAILEKRFGKNVEAQLLEKIVPEFYMQAIKEADLEPVSYPKIDENIQLKSGEPLSFTVTVEIKPAVENLNYDGITLKKKEASVTDEDVDRSIDLLRESRALYSATDESLEKEDMAVIDCDAFCDDQKIEELSHKEFPFVIGSEAMPDEFSNGLAGACKGEEKEIKVSFDDDYPNATVAGKELTFNVRVVEGKKKNLPSLDDEFAKDAECETVDELKQKVRDNLLKRKEDRINLEYKKDILDELLSRHEINAPSSMVEGEIESIVTQKKQDAARSGAEAGTDEEMIKEVRPRAEENVKSVLILESIGRQENIEVTDDDVSSAVEEIAQRNGLKPDEVRKLYAVREGSMDALKSRLFADKVLEFVLGKSAIED